VQCHDLFHVLTVLLLAQGVHLRWIQILTMRLTVMMNGKRYLLIHSYLFSFLGRHTHNLFSVQEDPGESLSDCEKDTDEIIEEDSKITDDEDEDSFVVPDGYLSDNEV
jgi:hypothetical protein